MLLTSSPHEPTKERTRYASRFCIGQMEHPAGKSCSVFLVRLGTWAASKQGTGLLHVVAGSSRDARRCQADHRWLRPGSLCQRSSVLLRTDLEQLLADSKRKIDGCLFSRISVRLADVTMKMTVITDKSGKVISTYIHPASPRENDPTLHIAGGPGHTTQDVEVPADFEKIASAEELHVRVGEYLKRGK